MREAMRSDINFSIEGYINLLNSVKSGGYKFSNYLENMKTNGLFFLRHDIDKSVKYALQMAKVEKEQGVQANYFFLLHSPLYNIMESETWMAVKEINELGHIIGLHCDERRIPSSSGDFDRDVMKDLKWLRTIFDFARPLVSFHNPSKTAVRRRALGDYISTYDPDFFDLPQTKYLSDSNREFREGDPKVKLSKGEWPRVQLLTHPVWWFGGAEPISDILVKTLKDRVGQLDDYLVYTNSCWEQHRIRNNVKFELVSKDKKR